MPTFGVGIGTRIVPPRRSIFAFCARAICGKIGITRYSFYTFKLICPWIKQNANHRHTLITPLVCLYQTILDFLATKWQKSTYVDFSVLARGKILRCFFIIQIANYSRHISITSSTAKAVPLPQQGRLIKQKASLSRDSIFLLAFFFKCPLKTVNEE